MVTIVAMALPSFTSISSTGTTQIGGQITAHHPLGGNPEFQEKITATIEDFLRNAGIQVSQTGPSPDGIQKLFERSAMLTLDQELLESQYKDLELLGGESRAASTIHPRLRQGKLVVFHSSGNPIGPHELVRGHVTELLGERTSHLNLSGDVIPRRTPTGILSVMNPGDRLSELTHIAEQLEELHKQQAPQVSRLRGAGLPADDLNALRDAAQVADELKTKKTALAESMIKTLEKTDPDFYEKLDEIFNWGGRLSGEGTHNAPGVFHAGTVRSAVERNEGGLTRLVAQLAQERAARQVGSSLTAGEPLGVFLHAYEIDVQHILPDIFRDEAIPARDKDTFLAGQRISKAVRSI